LLRLADCHSHCIEATHLNGNFSGISVCAALIGRARSIIRNQQATNKLKKLKELMVGRDYRSSRKIANKTALRSLLPLNCSKFPICTEMILERLDDGIGVTKN
jgi:hypothetical protein